MKIRQTKALIYGVYYTNYTRLWHHLSIFKRQALAARGTFILSSVNLHEWYLTFNLTYNLVDYALEHGCTIFISLV